MLDISFETIIYIEYSRKILLIDSLGQWMSIQVWSCSKEVIEYYGRIIVTFMTRIFSIGVRLMSYFHRIIPLKIIEKHRWIQKKKNIKKIDYFMLYWSCWHFDYKLLSVTFWLTLSWSVVLNHRMLYNPFFPSERKQNFMTIDSVKVKLNRKKIREINQILSLDKYFSKSY